MIAFPNAKINLGLTVLNKRLDGYHNLETIFYPIPIRDALEIVPAKKFKFNISGQKVPGNEQDNLVLKAYRLIKKEFPTISPVEIFLHKAIPMGAGLGGGSSDAAVCLELLKNIFNLGISQERISAIALELGSDTPFFLQRSACLASLRGENLEPIHLDLSSYTIVLVHPEQHISTAWAFAQIVPSVKNVNLAEIVRRPVTSWKGVLQNDFEKPVFANYPQLQEIKEKLYQTGAVYASMTGSGSTIFGLFEKNMAPELKIDQTKIHRIDL